MSPATYATRTQSNAQTSLCRDMNTTSTMPLTLSRKQPRHQLMAAKSHPEL